MQRPDNIHTALRHLHNLTMDIARTSEQLMDAATVNTNHLTPIKDAALDAHMLVTWIRDNLKELHQ